MVGILTYVPDPGWEQCEVLTLHVTGQWHGVGTALIEAVEQLAARHGCALLWPITTNDNVDALRFYQRRGFQLDPPTPASSGLRPHSAGVPHLLAEPDHGDILIAPCR